MKNEIKRFVFIEDRQGRYKNIIEFVSDYEGTIEDIEERLVKLPSFGRVSSSFENLESILKKDDYLCLRTGDYIGDVSGVINGTIGNY